MEKVVYIEKGFMRPLKPSVDGLAEINRYLENGWKVKHVSAIRIFDGASGAYFVLEYDE